MMSSIEIIPSMSPPSLTTGSRRGEFFRSYVKSSRVDCVVVGR
jgi:hypothetical protein